MLQQRPNQLRELDKIALALPRRLLLVLERAALKRATGQIDKVNARALERDAQVAAVLWGLTARLKLDAVEFDAEDEGWVGDAAPDFVEDFEDDA